MFIHFQTVHCYIISMNVTETVFFLTMCVHQDKNVSELAQELANKLDLKTRKAYVGLQVSDFIGYLCL